MTSSVVMLLALLLDISIGWPKPIFDRIRHPVVWIGAMTSLLEKSLNQPSVNVQLRKLNGILLTFLVTGSCALMATSIAYVPILGSILVIFFTASLLAIRSLYEHVAAVLEALERNDLAASRAALAHIVGRDVSNLSSDEIASAAMECLAESTCDGVVAPLFWGLLLGLPGLAAYKAINTLDSMIGHRNTRYEQFGWFAARCDDVANYLPARLTAFLIVLSTLQVQRVRDLMNDAQLHRSVNAGWPEAALAYSVHVRISGPRCYDGKLTDEPWINASAKLPSHVHLAISLGYYKRVITLLFLILLCWVGLQQ